MMHEIQQRLLNIARVEDIAKIKQKDLVRKVGCSYPSQIIHHMNQLFKRGDLLRTADGKIIVSPTQASSVTQLPVMGEVDCGEATRFADDIILNYLLLSDSILSIDRTRASYALVARGDSMNRSNIINGKPIHDGDYVVIEKKDNYRPKEGDYVVSIINGMANVKKIHYDDQLNRIILFSESYRNDYMPIIIAEQDQAHYHVAGQVVDVVTGFSI